MCGILGLLGVHADRGLAPALLERAVDTLAHRGPDARGSWQDTSAAVFLGHRRLAVIDLSASGAQPMHSRCGRYVITYNGEIYNFRELRRELEDGGSVLRGRSDTEVLLESIARDGLERTLARANGMFALALWDCAERTLWLARDRLGEKPLYYGVIDGHFVFASELKAIVAALGRTPPLDHAALGQFLRRSYVPEPACIYAGLHKLPPGSLLRMPARELPRLPQPVAYWSLSEVCAAGSVDPLTDASEAVAEVERVLQRAVTLRMIADVPLGAFLSGGIDSTLLVTLMQRASAQPLKTFTIGFGARDYDESMNARAIARHLGTEHCEHQVTSQEALDVIPLLPTIYDEPFADSSQIPSFLVARLARRQVTTVVTGDGGDEVFAGYLRYGDVLGVWQRLQALPLGLRRMMLRLLTSPSPRAWDRLMRWARPLLPVRLRYATLGDRLHKFARIGAAASLSEVYARLVAVWDYGVEAGAANPDTRAALARLEQARATDDAIVAMMQLDTLGYLPGDILTKVDRAAMAVSLETRVPFLDPAVIALAWRLPMSLKIRNGQSKWILRQILARYVPAALFERPKMGFAVPLDSWLRGPLREWAGDYLAEARLREAALIDSAAVTRLWGEHLAGTHNHQHALWNVLMFETWRAHWMGA